MSNYSFCLPDVGEGIVEAKITAWHVRVGDVVKQDQALLDVTTHKATMDITSPVEGRVVALHGALESVATVGSVLVEFELMGANVDMAAPEQPERLYSAAFRKHYSADSGIVTLLDTPQMRINFQRGDGGAAIVVVAGLGERMAGVLQSDFRDLTKTRGDVYYVVDHALGGFHARHDEIVETLDSHLRARGIEEVVALGNSMGGAGALAFAGALPHCRTVIAFGALTAFHPSIVPFEDRLSYTDRLNVWGTRDAVTSLRPDINYFLFYGTRCPQDMHHANRLLATGNRNVSIYLVGRCGHNVAKYLRQHLPFSDLLDAACTEGQTGVARLMRKVDYCKLTSSIPAWRILASRVERAVLMRLTGEIY